MELIQFQDRPQYEAKGLKKVLTGVSFLNPNHELVERVAAQGFCGCQNPRRQCWDLLG